MGTLKLYISFTYNNKEIEGFPLSFEQTVDEIQGALPYEKAADADSITFSALPVAEVDTVQFLYVKAEDKAVNIKVGTTIPLGIGGIIIIGKATMVDADMQINNPPGGVAKVHVLGGGT